MNRSGYSFFITAVFILAGNLSFAQADNEVYLFLLDKSSKGEYHLHDAKYLSKFNRGGYTNQPSFTPTGDLLVSVRKPGETQNDIYQLTLKTRKYKQLTKTRATEYSPRIHPDEEHLTVIRKKEGEPLDQQVCNINLSTGDYFCFAGEFKDIGYYTWLNSDELGFFRIDANTSQLSYFKVKENKSRRITSSVGRTLASDKNGALIYVHKFTDKYWYIKKYNPVTSAIDIVTQTKGNNEDFALASDGTYFMGDGHHLYTFHSDRNKEWKLLADLSLYGIKYITRIAVSADAQQLVLVATKEKQ